MRVTTRSLFLLPLAVGFTVFALTLVVSWQQYGAYVHWKWNLWGEEILVTELAKKIEEYRQEHGALPGSLAEISEEAFPSRRNEDRIPVDRWETPYQYELKGDSFVLYSCGTAGKPGGVGMHADLYPGRDPNWSVQPTFDQFLTELPSEGFFALAICSGLLTALLAGVSCLYQRSRSTRYESENRPPDPWPGLLIQLTSITVAALLVASVLAGLEVPTGH